MRAWGAVQQAFPRKKSGAQVARRISPTSFRGWWPEPGGGAWPRTRCRPVIASPGVRSPSGIGGESAETMIPPASRSRRELVHIAGSIRNHFAKSLDRPPRTKIAATEVTRQAAPTTGRIDDAQAIRSCTTCLDVTTLRSMRAVLNCTEVSGRHRNGWTGYTKVYEPGFAAEPGALKSAQWRQNRAAVHGADVF